MPRFLKDHRVQGSVVLPATAYIEMALAAAEQVSGPGEYFLEDVRFEEPLILPDGQPQTVQLILTHGDSGGMRFEVRRNAGREEWRLHASGRLGKGQLEGLTPPDALFDVRARCLEAIPAGEYYERLRAQGLEYGPGFRGLVQLHRGPGEALGKVELPDPLNLEAVVFHCHPALLDAALQVTAAGVDHEFSERGNSVPVAIERVCVRRSPSHKVWSHAKVRRSADGAGVSADVQVLDERGQLLVDVRGLQVRQLKSGFVAERPAIDSPIDPAKWFYEVQWRLQDQDAAEGHERRRWTVLTDRGGTGRALAKALEAGGDTCTLADPDGDVPDAPCSGVLYLQGLDYVAAESAADACAGVLRAIQTLAARAFGFVPRLYLITRGAQPAVPQEETLALGQAPLWGLGAVAALEHPDLRCTRIDLDPARGADDTAALLRELQSDGREDRVAYRGGHRYVARLVSRAGPAANQPLSLHQSQPGTLGGLVWKPEPMRLPAAGEVAIRVAAAGLNFRDVLNALGLYSGAAGPLGDECAGTVAAVGPGVTGLAAGDEVVALASGSFSTYVTASSDFVVARPLNLPANTAAGISIAFLTAVYGLRNLARLSAGDRVLIHAAAGGVGLAAVRVAQQIGAEIFATAGSPEKRSFLAAQGVKHVFDSRSPGFAAELRKAAGERGVEVILNSLGGEFIPASLAVLGPRGRFVEIGKRDIWTIAQVAAVHPDAEYYPFHLGDLMRNQPALVNMLLHEVVNSVAEGRLKPLPQREFSSGDVAGAFRHMAQARHIGKIVVAQKAVERMSVRTQATYLITGGLGALGLRCAAWLAARGARHLLLVSRNAPSADAQAQIRKLESAGVNVTVVAADVAQSADVERVLSGIGPSVPLCGTFHAAGVLDDGVLLQQDGTRFAKVMNPKVRGAWNLHLLTRHHPLDFFVLFSSVVALAGTAGQGNYAAANAFLDALAHYRRASGLPALSVNWGAWAEAGMAAQVSGRDRRRWSERGISLIPPEQGLQALEDLLSSEAVQATVLPVQWETFLQQFPAPNEPPFYAEIPRSPRSKPASASPPALRRQLSEETLPHKRREILAAYVRDQVVQVLGLDAAQALDPTQPIRELGVDSLMAVEIRNALSLPFGEKLSVALLYDYPTIDALTEYLLARAAPAEPGPAKPASPESAPEPAYSPLAGTARQKVEQASEQDAEALLIKELEALNF